MYHCPFCLHIYPTSNHLIAHIKLKHSIKVYKHFQCQQPNCCRSFCNISTYNKHLALKHPLPTKSLTLPMPKVPIDVIEPVCNTDLPNFSNSSPVELNLSGSGAVGHCTNVEEFRNSVHKSSASFVARLYSNNSLSRALVQDIIENINELFTSGNIHMIKQKYNSNTGNTIDNQLNEMFDVLISAFDNLKTEYQRIKFFESCNTFIKPNGFIIGTSLDSKIVDQTRSIDVIELTGQIIPMDRVLKHFLELPNVFDSIISYMNQLKLVETYSFLQTELWMGIEQRFQGNNKLVLPLIIYFDDFEVNNPLGSHKGINKLGAVYFTLGVIPPEYSSLLENIFLAQLHNSQDQLTYGNRSVFTKLIDQINHLETNGITINIGNEKKHVFFTLTHILGDNLGIHSILGFTESFNSTYACRFCRVDKNILQSQLYEDMNYMLRTKENYAEDASDLKYGIKEKCVFHDIPSFNVTENLSCDVTHDYLEGVCRYDMAKISDILINKDKLFSLDQLNDRIRYFDYGSAVVGNIPLAITSDALRKGVIICSASEMLCLVYYFGLIVGDLVPTGHKAWELYIILRQIISLVMARSFRKEAANLLRTLVSEHHSLYLEIFKEPLKPKHHFMVHHPTILQKCGPLHNMSTIRFEGKHQELKQNAKVAMSRKNISYTLALKHQLKLNYRLFAQKGFDERISMGAGYEVDLSDLDKYPSFKNTLPDNFDFTDKYLSVPWVKVNGITYKTGNVIIPCINMDTLQFGEIKYILIDKTNSAHFIFLKIVNKGFVEHTHAFEVALTDKWNYTSQKNLTAHNAFSIHVMSDGVHYVPCD